MSEYSEEQDNWDLAEKIFIQYHSNRLTVRIDDVIKAAYESAKTFNQIKNSALKTALEKREAER